jgi:hypothetical protein
MNSSLPGIAATVTLAAFAFFGGAFVYALLHSRLIKKAGWPSSVGGALGWMILYALASIMVSDLCTAGLRTHPHLVIGVTMALILLPYIAAVRVWIVHGRTGRAQSSPDLS